MNEARPGHRGILLVVACASLLLSSANIRGQDKAIDAELEFWGETRRMQAGSAGMVVAAHDPFLAAALRLNGLRVGIWDEPAFVHDKAPPLDSVWLPLIRDDTFPPDFSKRENFAQVKQSEWAYRTVLRDALRKSVDTPPDIFENSVEYPSVKWEQLMTSPGFYRGKVVSIEGKLRKLETIRAEVERPLPPPLLAIYGAWIETPTNPRPVFCLVTAIPEDLKPYENTVLDKPQPVKFTGYFIMRYKYQKSDASKEEVITPMLIGQTLYPGAAPARTESPPVIPVYVFIWLGVIFVSVIVIIAILGRLYRHGDQKVMARVEEMRRGQADDSLFQDEPVSGPEPADESSPSGAERNGLSQEHRSQSMDGSSS